MKFKKSWITFFVILAVVIIAYFILTGRTNSPTASASVAQCIGNKSAVYVQLGCSACKAQEDMFGNNYKYVNSTDCFYFPEKCQNITATPTWIINGKTYIGVQNIDNLKNLTGC